MSFEKEACTPDEVADHLEEIADALRDGDRDAARQHLGELFDEMFDCHCEPAGLKAAHATAGAHVDGLRSAAADMRAAPTEKVDWKGLFQKILPIILQLLS